jgi:general stress protein CsbA
VLSVPEDELSSARFMDFPSCLVVLLFTRITHRRTAFTFTVSCVINLTVVSGELVSLQLSYLACRKTPFTDRAVVRTHSFDF